MFLIFRQSAQRWRRPLAFDPERPDKLLTKKSAGSFEKASFRTDSTRCVTSSLQLFEIFSWFYRSAVKGSVLPYLRLYFVDDKLAILVDKVIDCFCQGWQFTIKEIFHFDSCTANIKVYVCIPDTQSLTTTGFKRNDWCWSNTSYSFKGSLIIQSKS